MTNRLRGADAASLTREKLMNIKQLKRAISTFRSADVSILKDDALRAKAQKLQAKQKGFTLLELLVVITLLATLATAALTAYNGIGDSASDTAAANNLLSAQSALNNYRAIESGYPDQWDNIANASGVDASGGEATGVAILRAGQTSSFLGQWLVTDAGTDTSVWKAVADAMNAVGIEELQSLDSNATFATGFVPNLALNESYPLTTNPGTELEFWASDASGALFGGTSVTTASISIVPSGGDAGTCSTVGGGNPSLASPFTGTALIDNKRLNLISDALDDDACALVLAVGYGKDVPGSTSGDKVEISQVPTLGTNNVNPANNYARAIALFHVGSADEDGITPDVIQVTDIFKKARLIGLVDPEGRVIDQVLASANQDN